MTGVLPVDLPKNDVEVNINDQKLQLLLSHVRRCWEYLGSERPHHSVITNRDFLPAAFKGNESKFWASGEQDAIVLEKILARNGVSSLEKLACIDFGCGVGRVTGPLTKRFATVDAYDISAPHIEIAKTRADAATFHLLREIPERFVPADVFYSRIVLQHNPPPIIALIVRAALLCLRPGGICVFQVPTYEIGYGFAVDAYLRSIEGKAPDMEMHCLPQHHIFSIAAEIGCKILEIREEGSAGRADRYVSNLFVIKQ